MKRGSAGWYNFRRRPRAGGDPVIPEAAGVTGSSAFADDDSRERRAFMLANSTVKQPRLRPCGLRRGEPAFAHSSAARIFCRGAGCACLLSVPPKIEGVERREAHPSSFRAALPFESAGASWRSTAARVLRHLPPRHRPRVRAFRDDETYRQSPSASSSRRGRSAPRAEPRASRGRGYEPRARAPHRRGEGKPLAPAREAPMPHLRHRFLPDGPAVVTSRDDAPRQARRIGI